MERRYPARLERPERPLIAIDPEIMGGKPTITGTRLTVEHVLEDLAGGLSPDDLLEAYPRLTREGLEAALAYAADLESHRP
jgi:uncharacterized protein (DUF433 family)